VSGPRAQGPATREDAGGVAPSRVTGDGRRRSAAALALALFVVYNANLRDGGGLDAFGSTVMPVSILAEGDFDLDELAPWIRDELPVAYARGLFAFGSVQERDGHLLSSYPPGSAVLATPVYALPWAAGWLEGWHALRVAGKLSASLIVALSAALLFLALRDGLARGPALLLAASYGLGTTAWPIASQGMWQHGPGLLCLSAALLALVRLERGGGAGVAALAGAALGFAVIVRTTNLVPASALALFVLLRHRRHLLPFAAPAAVMAGWLLWYNLSTFGAVSGGYGAVYGSAAHSWREHDLSSVFSNPLGHGLASILVAPSKGLLVYSPHLLFGLLAALAAFRLRERLALAPWLALWVAASLVLLAKNRLWWGGTAFGPRYLSETTPALTLLIAAAWPWLAARRWALRAFGCAVALSISVQALGAFFAPCGWSTEPVWADRHPERHWDWRDPEILRCLRRGLAEGPLPPELLEPESSSRHTAEGELRRGL